MARRMRNRVLRWGALCACAAAAGCGILATSMLRETVSRFPHSQHLEGAKLACGDCHGTASGPATYPPRATCEECHDRSSAQLAPFFTAEGPRWAHAGAQSADIVFDHAAHAARRECTACHADVAASQALYAGSAMRMDACTACHNESAAAVRTCAACHRETRVTTRPSTHAGPWTQRHGAHADTRGRTADRCSLCHAESACRDCHTTERPRTHTPAWRDFGHGLAAGIERERCLVCHTRDQCDSCHTSTAPRDHRGGFTASDAHCMRCHIPFSRDDRCGVCHTSLPAHPPGEAMPGDATHATAAAAQCRACHAGGEEDMRHPDNGDDCRYCHE